MKTAKDWIKDLALRPHPEGGFYAETFKGDRSLQGEAFDRPIYSSIYFLLEEDNPSNFHRLRADEVWYFHSGSPLTIHMLTPEGAYKRALLGPDPSKGMVLSYCVEAGLIFGASVDQGYALVSCMVSPAFDFRDFTLYKRQDLIKSYPQHEEIIDRLCQI